MVQSIDDDKDVERGDLAVAIDIKIVAGFPLRWGFDLTRAFGVDVVDDDQGVERCDSPVTVDIGWVGIVVEGCGVFDDEDLAGFAVFVDAEGAAGGGLGVGLTEEFLALEHEGEDVAGVFRVFLILLAERAQEFLGALFGDGLWILGGEDGAVCGAPG